MSEPTDDPIVGHKTFDDGHGGFRHEPLVKSEADRIIAAIESRMAAEAIKWPTAEHAALDMSRAFHHLEHLGWRRAEYAPYDQEFEIIEAGSSGIHRGRRDKSLDCWWIDERGDSYPSHPILYNPKTVAIAQLEAAQQTRKE